MAPLYGFSKIIQSHSCLSNCARIQIADAISSCLFILLPVAPCLHPHMSPTPCLSHCYKAEYLFPLSQCSGLLKGVWDRAHIRQHVCICMCNSACAVACAVACARDRAAFPSLIFTPLLSAHPSPHRPNPPPPCPRRTVASSCVLTHRD